MGLTGPWMSDLLDLVVSEIRREGQNQKSGKSEGARQQ